MHSLPCAGVFERGRALVGVSGPTQPRQAYASVGAERRAVQQSL